MTISAAQQPGSTAPAQARPARPAPHGRVDAAFRSARRHSDRVRVLKLVLPALAVLMIAAFFARSWFAVPGGVSFDLGAAAIEEGRLVMADPRLDGFTTGDRAYTVTAARAIQDIGEASRVDLEGIDARLALEEEGWITVRALTGVFDRAANTLELGDDITVATDAGVTARLRSASVDIASGRLVTDDPVDVEGQGTRIEAQSMTVTDNGAVLVFERRVRVEIDAMRGQAAPPAEGGKDGN